MEDTSGWSIDADLAFAPLAELGWRAEWLPWQREGVDWSVFDAVYPAATWDYPEHPERFLAVLEAIDRSSAVLVNALELIRWNIPKTYLRDLRLEARPCDEMARGEFTAHVEVAFSETPEAGWSVAAKLFSPEGGEIFARPLTGEIDVSNGYNTWPRMERALYGEFDEVQLWSAEQPRIPFSRINRSIRRRPTRRPRCRRAS